MLTSTLIITMPGVLVCYKLQISCSLIIPCVCEFDYGLPSKKHKNMQIIIIIIMKSYISSYAINLLLNTSIIVVYVQNVSTKIVRASRADLTFCVIGIEY